ncbi:uncharacterized protein PG986_001159 [Apiospora aurea]|uniref:Uncharacterized protein n=1 Tax=Apiospora aurea TaxID=335848 RepID=A0ABR1QW14_9PEZI
MHPDMRSHQHPWHAYRATIRGMPYRRFYGGGFPLLRLAFFGAGSYFIAKYVVRDELRRDEALRQQQQKTVRCSDCSSKIEAAQNNNQRTL